MKISRTNLRTGFNITAIAAALLFAVESGAQQATTAPQAAAVKPNTLLKIKQNGFVTMAHRESSVPFSYIDETTKVPIGYTVDLCKKIIEAIRVELKLGRLETRTLLVKPADRLPSIKEGRADIECGNTTNNPDRRKEVSFAIPTYIDGAKLMSKSSLTPRSMSDLAGRKVVTIEKSTSEKLLNEHNSKYSTRIDVITTKDHKESFEKLNSGAAEIWMMDGILLASFRAQSAKPTDFSISAKFLTVEPLAVMYAKDDDAFGAVINKEIRRMMQTGEINTIYKKWFQSPVPPKGINLDVSMSPILQSFINSPTTEMPQNF